MRFGRGQWYASLQAPRKWLKHVFDVVIELLGPMSFIFLLLQSGVNIWGFEPAGTTLQRCNLFAIDILSLMVKEAHITTSKCRKI